MRYFNTNNFREALEKPDISLEVIHHANLDTPQHGEQSSGGHFDAVPVSDVLTVYDSTGINRVLLPMKNII